MASQIVEYVQGAELDALTLQIEDGTGALINMSSGYTFSLKVGTTYATAFTKTSNIGLPSSLEYYRRTKYFKPWRIHWRDHLYASY
jgi:hypothetical protein